jgi:hypothetical protein
MLTLKAIATQHRIDTTGTVLSQPYQERLDSAADQSKWMTRSEMFHCLLIITDFSFASLVVFKHTEWDSFNMLLWTFVKVLLPLIAVPIFTTMLVRARATIFRKQRTKTTVFATRAIEGLIHILLIQVVIIARYSCS